jgi:predicted solute-binding protein
MSQRKRAAVTRGKEAYDYDEDAQLCLREIRYWWKERHHVPTCPGAQAMRRAIIRGHVEDLRKRCALLGSSDDEA